MAQPKVVVVQVPDTDDDRDIEKLDHIDIVAITEHGKDKSGAATRRWWNAIEPNKRVSERTVQRILEYFAHHKAYYEHKKRGRPQLLTAEEDAALEEACELFRTAKKSIASPDVVAIAEGIIERTERRALLSKNGGPLLLSESWAKQWLCKKDFKKRHATTDRTVTTGEVVDAGTAFFARISAVVSGKKIDPRLLFNMDEFFVVLESMVRGWTWTRVVPGVPIAIAKSKLGFTAAVTVSAASEVVLLDIIWQGSTSAVHADVQHSVLFQHHRADSHFQDASTFAVWAGRLRQHVRLQQERDATLQDTIPVIVIDHAPQHGDYAQLFPGWIVCMVPKKMTHIFQPCDQHIIANLRAFTRGAWREFVTTVFATHTVEGAVQAILTTSIPIMRNRKIEFLCRATDHLGASIEASWEITGLLRAFFQLAPKRAVVFDQMCKQNRKVEVVDALELDEAAEKEQQGAEFVRNSNSVRFIPAVTDFVLVQTAEEPTPKRKRGRPSKIEEPTAAKVSVLDKMAQKARLDRLEGID